MFKRHFLLGRVTYYSATPRQALIGHVIASWTIPDWLCFWSGTQRATVLPK